MAYTNLEIIEVYNGTRSNFISNITSYKDKLVLVTGGLKTDTSGKATNIAKDPYLFAVDGSGNYREIDVPKQWVHAIKINGESAVYTDGNVDFRTVAGKGVSLSYDSANKAILIDSTVLHTLASNASTNATNAGTTAASALEKANANANAITNLKDGDTGSIRDIAADEVDKLRDEVFGDSTEADSIPALREDVDEISDEIVEINKNFPISIQKSDDGLKYVITQGDATDTTGAKWEIDIPKDMVISSGKVVKNPTGQAAGTYLELTLANAESGKDKIYINVADLVDAYTAQANATQVQIAISGTNVISATIKSKSIGETELADGAVTTNKISPKQVTSAKIADNTITTGQLATSINGDLALAHSSTQEVASATTDYISVGGTDLSAGGKKFNVSAGTATIADVSSDATKKGLATAEDVFAYLKARLSIKIQQ